jgi:hypothetical protein
MAALIIIAALCVWFLLKPSANDVAASGSHVKAVAGAAARPEPASRDGKEVPAAPRKDAVVARGASVPRGERAVVGSARQGSSAQEAKDELIARVKAWEDLVDDVVREDNATPLPERGQKLKAALKEVPDSEKTTGVQTLLNLLPDETFAMVEPILLDPAENPEVLDAIFSDMLNRPDELKNPYIIKISKMKNHPQFTDAMHIKTVTELEEDGDAAKQKEEETGNNE